MMHATKRKLIAAVKAECKRVHGDISGQLQALTADDDQRAAVVCQNVLRTCMEAAVDQALPFTALLPAELAVRLASYAISILPVDDHDAAIDAVIRTLPQAHRARIAKGIMIQTTWLSDAPSDPTETRQ